MDLVIRRAGAHFQLSWPLAGGFLLETSPVLRAAATWTALGTNSPATVDAANTRSFFRLRPL